MILPPGAGPVGRQKCGSACVRRSSLRRVVDEVLLLDSRRYDVLKQTSYEFHCKRILGRAGARAIRSRGTKVSVSAKGMGELVLRLISGTNRLRLR